MGKLTIAKDEQLLALASGHLGQQRQQVVGGTLGVLAHDASGVRTAGVEVAQQGAVPLLVGLAGLLQVVALSVDVVGDDVLNAGLGAAVRVGRADGAVLRDGNHVGHAGCVAVDGGRRREDNVGHVVASHGAKQRDAAADVDAVVLEGNLGRLADSLESGKVNHAVNLGVLVEDGVEALLVTDVDIVKVRALARQLLDAVDDVLKRVVQVVDNDDVVVGVEQGERREGANIAGSSASWSALQSERQSKRAEGCRGAEKEGEG